MSKQFEFGCFEYCQLPPDQQARVREEAVRRGLLARDEAVRAAGSAVAAGVARALKRIRAVMATGRVAILSWAQRRAERASLHALEPRLLRDIGIDASEIESIVGYDPDGLTHDQFRLRHFPMTPA